MAIFEKISISENLNDFFFFTSGNAFNLKDDKKQTNTV